MLIDQFGEEMGTMLFNGGTLNPDWCEAYMGFPVGWTDLDAEVDRSVDMRRRWWDGSWQDGLSIVTEKKENRVKRINSLGNAVVPQIAEIIGKMIIEAKEQ